jgi:DNA-binding transcriptional LysR family regulator
MSPRGKAQPWVFSESVFDEPASVQLDHGELLVDAAVAGVGVVQVLDFMVERHVRDGQLVELLPELAAAGPTIHAVRSARRRNVPRVNALVELVTHVFSRFGPRGRREDGFLRP